MDSKAKLLLIDDDVTLLKALEIYMTRAGYEVFTAGNELPLKFTAYDGSSAGPDDAEIVLDLRTPRGTTYLATAPGDLGLARAYVSGDLEARGVHPGDPYALLRTLARDIDFRRPPARVLAQIVRSIGLERLRPVPPPPAPTGSIRLPPDAPASYAPPAMRSLGQVSSGFLRQAIRTPRRRRS